MPWRPQIPDELESKIEEVVEPAGYQSKSELVRDAARRKVEELNADGESSEEVGTKNEKVCENLKEIALDRSRGMYERRDAVKRLGELGDVAVEPLSEVAKDAEDTAPHKLDDDKSEANGDDIRKRARKQLENINKE
ncbi:ribbon-helix-helix domain-containing protein [Halovenus salina]|uniref:Ribbon-helix-helix domain-containing protein n=1 Tax=Halovenus salina TaxID=1510225 RepID=A0ABD5W500_9EURY|nr:ribbon-helix-helix domain-containing protein [Halovenus salina]